MSFNNVSFESSVSRFCTLTMLCPVDIPFWPYKGEEYSTRGPKNIFYRFFVLRPPSHGFSLTATQISKSSFFKLILALVTVR